MVESGSSSGDSTEIKRLLEENQKLKSLNKDREDLLKDLEMRSKSMRETETKLKIKENELELISGSKANFETKYREKEQKL